MKNRRDFLKHSLLSVGAMPFVPGLFANAAGGNAPKRFIFVHKGNGLFPKVMVPPTLNETDVAKEKRKEAFNVSLADHDLPEWMGALNEHKDEITILQGLSGKMCTTGHHTWQSSLGVYKANERPSSIKWATVDFELAKLFPSPMEHIEFACFPNSGGNSRGNIEGIEKGFSARGPQQPNYAFGSPKVAMQELFKSVTGEKDSRVKYELERKVLQFVAENQSELGQDLTGIERSKIYNYADSVQSIRERNQRVEAMGDVIRKHLPQLDDKYFVEDLNTVDRQQGFVEILLSTLISGMTNVVAFTIDELGTTYTGVKDIENENINLHDVGHNKGVGSFGAEEVREKVRRHHMDALNGIVSRLKDVPEDGGSMFDNTMVLYFPDNGETHHSHGTEWPFIVMSGKNCKLDIAGQYIRLPNYGQEGHKTLGNWYTTVLNAYGNPTPHYGAIDTGLSKYGIDQTGPIPQFLG